MPTVLENFGPFSSEKLCTQVLTCPQLPLPHIVNQRSEELRWLVTVGMFLQS